MLLSLVDSLRCPAEHEETPLVLSVEGWAGSRVSSGMLGCPRCHARYAIREGVVDFVDGAEGAALVTKYEKRGSDAIRLAAQLGLSDGGGIVLLTGRYASVAEGLLGVVDVTCLIVDAREALPAEVVLFRLQDRVPLISGVLRAAAVDEPRNTSLFLAEVARCVRDAGRVVAPSGSPLPPGIRLLARDDEDCVGEIERAVPTISLRRSAVRR